jgi:hypothetical protein
MSSWHLAQINVARLAYPREDPQVRPFFDALDRINALADASPGFRWRLADEAGNATSIQPTADPLLIVNVSVWESPEALFAFVYHSDHRPVMAQRREWFVPFGGAYQALWWVEAGHQPSVDEGLARLW